jgi:hypothetical protein
LHGKKKWLIVRILTKSDSKLLSIKESRSLMLTKLHMSAQSSSTTLAPKLLIIEKWGGSHLELSLGLTAMVKRTALDVMVLLARAPRSLQVVATMGMATEVTSFFVQHVVFLIGRLTMMRKNKT